MRGQPHVADHHRLRSYVGARVDLRLNVEKSRAFRRVHAGILPLLRFFVQFTLTIFYKPKVSIFSQARTGLLALAIVAWPALAQANIGDDLQALRGHYGSAKDMGGQMLFEVRLVNGQIQPARGSADTDDHFSVAVYFDGTRSAMEVFTRNTSDPDKAQLQRDDIDTILAAASDGLTWNEVRVPTGHQTWVRSDNKLIARFSPDTGGKPDDASVLVIMLNSK